MAKFSVKPGDRVAYTIKFLKAIKQSHEDMSRDRGVVLSVKKYGERVTLVMVRWEGDSPNRVNVRNLAKVGPNTRFANC